MPVKLSRDPKGRVLIRSVTISTACALAAYALSYLLHDLYRVQQVLYFPMASQSPGTGLAGLTRSSQGDAGAVTSLGGALNSPLVGSSQQVAAGILTSGTVLKRVSNKVRLEAHYHKPTGEAVRLLRQRLTIDIDPQNGFLVVGVDDQDPTFAQKVLLALDSELNRRTDEITINVSRKNRQFIEQRLAKAEREADLEQSRVAGRSGSGLWANPDLLQKTYFDARTQQQVSRVALQAAEAQYRAAVNQARTMLATQGTSAGVLVALHSVNENLQELSTQLQRRQLELADARKVYRSDSREYRNAVEQLATTQRVANEVIDREDANAIKGALPSLSEVARNLDGFRVSVSLYNAYLNELEQEMRKAVVQSSDQKRAESRYTASLDLASNLRAELETARIAEERDPARYETIDAPGRDGERVFPKRSLIAAGIFLLTLFVQLLPVLLRAFAGEEAPDSANYDPI